MKKRICVIMLFMLCFSTFICITNVGYAAESIVTKLDDMKQVTDTDMGTGSDQGIMGAINSVIGLMQYVGSGIALIVITILGIKYILASPSEKADVKKSIMPVIIGCVLLFGGVNIAALIVKFTNGATGNS